MIAPVDRRVKILEDGTKIYVMNTVTRQHYSAYFDYWHDQAQCYEWSRERQDHSAVKKMFYNEFSEIAEWLIEQGGRTTYWIDPEIHGGGGIRSKPLRVYNNPYLFEYGIGFLPNDPIETAFILRWL